MKNDITIKEIENPEQLNKPEEATDYADCFNAWLTHTTRNNQ
jgi:hypothetical protein